MRASEINVGDRLRLKRDNAYGFGPEIVTVTEITMRDGYKRPWIWGSFVYVNPFNDMECPDSGAFRPSDFSGHA